MENSSSTKFGRDLLFTVGSISTKGASQGFKSGEGRAPQGNIFLTCRFKDRTEDEIFYSIQFHTVHLAKKKFAKRIIEGKNDL